LKPKAHEKELIRKLGLAVKNFTIVYRGYDHITCKNNKAGRLLVIRY
jgi:hypothetical protein